MRSEQLKNKPKRHQIIPLLLIGILIISTGCETSSLQQAFEHSTNRQILINKEFLPKEKDIESNAKEQIRGYFSISSKDDGATIEFSGFYQLKSVHINTKEAQRALSSHTVEEFAKDCGYTNYKKDKNEAKTFDLPEIMNNKDYVVYFITSSYGGDLYLGKKFSMIYKKDKKATTLYEEMVHLSCREKFSSSKQLKADKKLNYVLQLNYQPINKTNKKENKDTSIFLGETKYTYEMYTKMEEFLFTQDAMLFSVYEKTKGNPILNQGTKNKHHD